MMIMSKINVVTVHGGHNPQGKIACGASDYIDESKEDRIITKKVVALLKKIRLHKTSFGDSCASR